MYWSTHLNNSLEKFTADISGLLLKESIIGNATLLCQDISKTIANIHGKSHLDFDITTPLPRLPYERAQYFLKQINGYLESIYFLFINARARELFTADFEIILKSLSQITTALNPALLFNVSSAIEIKQDAGPQAISLFSTTPRQTVTLARTTNDLMEMKRPSTPTNFPADSTAKHTVDAIPVESSNDLALHAIKIPESPPKSNYRKVNLETSILKDKTLYGLFIKFRRVSNISNALSASMTDITLENKVVLFEWRKNRLRNTGSKGQQYFKFSEIPLVWEGGAIDAAVTESDSELVCYLEEKEPLRITQEKIPNRFMHYEKEFDRHRKPHLKIPHVILDNRRRYQITCPAEFWPVYQIWEIKGLRIQDKVSLVFRSPEAPDQLTPGQADATTTQQQFLVQNSMQPQPTNENTMLSPAQQEIPAVSSSFEMPHFDDMENLEGDAGLDIFTAGDSAVNNIPGMSGVIEANTFTSGLDMSSGESKRSDNSYMTIMQNLSGNGLSAASAMEHFPAYPSTYPVDPATRVQESSEPDLSNFVIKNPQEKMNIETAIRLFETLGVSPRVKEDNIPYINKSALIKIPPAGWSSASTLLSFIEIHSNFKKEDSILTGKYRYKEQDQLFQCILGFKHGGKETLLIIGKGDTKLRARENGAVVLLEKLQEAMDLLDVNSVNDLHNKLHPRKVELKKADATETESKQETSVALKRK